MIIDKKSRALSMRDTLAHTHVESGAYIFELIDFQRNFQ